MASGKSSFVSSEEVINHYGAVRLRVLGSANLNLALYSLDEVMMNVLSPLMLQAKNNVELNRLSNFTQQRAKLELRTTEIDETFKVSKIIVFAKPVAKSWPEGAQVPSAGALIFSPIVMPQGSQGIAGPQGMQGIQGIQGVAGPTIKPAFAQTLETAVYVITGSFADITGLSVSITPTSATSKVRVSGNVNIYLGNGLAAVSCRLMRNGVSVRQYDTVAFNNNLQVTGATAFSFDYIDTPNLASPIVYKLQAMNTQGGSVINNIINGPDLVTSSITAEELLV